MSMTKKDREYVALLEMRVAHANALRYPPYPKPQPVLPTAYPDSYESALVMYTHIHDERFGEHLVCKFGFKERSKDGSWEPNVGWRRHYNRVYYTTLVAARMAHRWESTENFAGELSRQDALINELQEAADGA